MNQAYQQISVMSSAKTAVAFLSLKVELNEEKEAANDFPCYQIFGINQSIKQNKMGKPYVFHAESEDMTWANKPERSI